jgi:hypothetical protein
LRTLSRASRLPGAAVIALSLAIVVVVRASAPGGRYTVTNGTVYDTKTKLTWQQGAPLSPYTEAGAASYCSTLGLNGATWRLPTMKELVSIVDFSGAPLGSSIDATAFPGTRTDVPYWCSTPYVGSAGNAWYVDFSSAEVSFDAVGSMYYARCVH